MDEAYIARTTRMVWLLTGIGLATGAVTLAIVGSALWVVMNAQRREQAIDARLSRLVESSHEACEQAEQEFARLLSDDPGRSDSPQWLPTSAELASYGELVRQCPALSDSMARVRTVWETLRELDEDCRAWAQDQDERRTRLRAAWQRTQLAVAQLGTGPEAPRAATDALRQALVRLERVPAGATVADVEAIVREQLAPAIAPLRGGNDQPGPHSQLVESLVGGPWPAQAADLPLPGPNSLLALLRQDAEAGQRRVDLRHRARVAIAAMHAASHELRADQAQVRAQHAQAVEGVFRQAWRAVLLAGTMTIGFFLVTCWKLPRVLESQLTAIRRNVAELETARQGLKVQNVALEQAHQRAEFASRGKSEILALVSHEFRTPLAAILGYADVLCEGPLPAELGDAAQAIRRNGQHLLSVVGDMLDLARIEARRLEIAPAPCSLNQTLRDALAAAAPRGQRRGVKLLLQFATPLPVVATTDPTRLRQMVSNLAAGALDLMEEGAVVITAECSAAACADQGNRAVLRIELLAPGVGLAASQLERLFEPFAQSHAASGQGSGDIGLGLSIARRLANLLGGELRVATELGIGTRFTLEVPVTIDAATAWEVVPGATDGPPSPLPVPLAHGPAAESPAPTTARVGTPARTPATSPSAEIQTGLRILVAEDGPDNQRLIARVLKRIGAEVEMVSNGAQAVDLALRNTRTGSPYSVILMDMQMPILDGYSATRRLRDAGYDGPIIALTAHAMSHDRQRCLDAGCTDYATKPLEIATLQLMIRKYATEEAACRL
jgi:signal transduction histidine kinase/CheY-like chemotaxis protein